MVPKPPAQIRDIIRYAWGRDAGVRELGKRLYGCPGLSDMVVRFVNSQHMDLGSEVSHANRAVLLLGARSTGTLAIAHAFAEVIRAVPIDGSIKRLLVEDCVLRAAIACGLAKHFPNIQVEQAFVVGLLSEGGKLVSILKDPANAMWMDHIRGLTGRARLDKENDYFGSIHTDDLRMLCVAWGLPRTLSMPLVKHHEIKNTPEGQPHDLRMICRWGDLLSEVVNATDPRAAWTDAKRRVMVESDLSEQDLIEIMTTGLNLAPDTAWVLGLEVAAQPPFSALMSLQDEDPGSMGRDALLRVVQCLKRERDSAKRQLEEIKLRLNGMRTTDTLTSLASRVRYFDALRSEVEKSGRTGLAVAVVHVDVDNLEQHNLSYGHEAGDSILKTVATTLNRVTGDSDIVARIGGDEFALVLPHTTTSGGRILAERIRSAIESMCLNHDGRQIRVSATVVGLSLEDAPGSSAEDLHNRAAAMMEEVKGANRVRWAA